MRTIVGGRWAASETEFAELALGVDPELFAGVDGESDDERAARVDAARDMLAGLWVSDPDIAAYAAALLIESTTTAPSGGPAVTAVAA